MSEYLASDQRMRLVGPSADRLVGGACERASVAGGSVDPAEFFDQLHDLCVAQLLPGVIGAQTVSVPCRVSSSL